MIVKAKKEVEGGGDGGGNSNGDKYVVRSD